MSGRESHHGPRPMGSTLARFRFRALVAILFAFSIVLVPSADRVESDYWGVRILPPGPAEDGLPLVPIRIAPDGSLVALPTHLEWYWYWADLSGLDPRWTGSSELTIHVSPGVREALPHLGGNAWWEPLLGQRASADMFPAIGSGLPAKWRAGERVDDHLPLVVLRVDEATLPDPVREEFAPDGFLGVFAASTHLGCIVSFDATSHPRAVASDGSPLLYDTCHGSRWDWREIRRYETPPGSDD
jgi:hypothetical protein